MEFRSITPDEFIDALANALTERLISRAEITVPKWVSDSIPSDAIYDTVWITQINNMHPVHSLRWEMRSSSTTRTVECYLVHPDGSRIGQITIHL